MMMELKGKHILVVGLGKSGKSVARFLKNRDAVPTVTDSAPAKKLEEAARHLAEIGVRTELGGHRVESFERADLIVLSPGVPHTIEPVERAKRLGVPVIGEVELASRFIREPMIAITGSNGKTTTTTLIGEMLKASGKSVFVGGNIGNPLIDYADGADRVQWIVAEISSFQLDTIETFRPDIALLLNITEDHLDRYPDFAAYARSKARIFSNQRPDDLAVLNGSDPMAIKISSDIRSRKRFFDFRESRDAGAVITRDGILFPLDGRSETLNRGILQACLRGVHNAENIAAAGLATLAAGGTMEGIRSAVRSFRGLSHRLEHVAEQNRIRYVNDSKATNVDAVEKALTAFSEPVILLMGGRDKGGNFTKLTPRLKQQVKLLVLFGEAAPVIREAIGAGVPAETTATLEQAVQRASSAASPGEVVLLSPGCASFDQFQNYAQRGEAFRLSVENLLQGRK
jgi:UDP-N-acetylmuramoylalanine--D-glutamate ligase